MKQFVETHHHHHFHKGRHLLHGRGHFFGPRGFGGGSAHGQGGRSGRGPMGGGHGGGGRRRLFTNDALQLILLKLIAQGPRHGYDLIREIESLSGQAYAPSPGIVYPTLTLLADMGLIAEQASGSGRKQFEITEAGTARLAEQASAVEEAMGRLALLAQRAERVDGAPIRRAMHNLSMAVRGRLEREGADSQTMLDVAALIDEAASKIERL
ncbi:helix-turn-helix transcriptional regulator [Sphingomonadales bacterium 56]|uniref:PadR family transcriptional regulator n=1 Tax=unclassified Sphingobium TaxID=2611147 RepID=UPI001918D333|nr:MULTISPECIES: PadR family transcriptional regulator [unclassified Sphingobium]MBY2928613.1 helix-turn-helix transcriptional regulator [Sphingomonadales bacterium 56]MBY2959539.1 helix-turn-helix transcriptional regulator [Sphingomonadales bacterium 58]